MWIGASDVETQGLYLYTDGEELIFTPPWAKNQDDNRDDGAGRKFIRLEFYWRFKFSDKLYKSEPW